jgi:site-specific recombinase XerD
MGVSPQTLVYYDKKLYPFVQWCSASGMPNIEDVTATGVRTYIVSLQQRNLAPSTVHGYARTIKALLSFCAADGLIDVAPRFVMPKVPQEILAAFTPSDVVRLLNACNDPRDRLIVLFLLDTGVRASEFVALNGSDIDLATGGVMVRKGKGSKGRMVYLGAKTCRELTRYWREYGKPASNDPVFESLTTSNRLTGDGLRQLLQRLGDRAQVENCHPHTFRRTFALWSLRAGMDVFSLQRLMGHSDLQVLRRYLDQTDLDIATAHQQHGAIDAVLGRAV